MFVSAAKEKSNLKRQVVFNINMAKARTNNEWV